MKYITLIIGLLVVGCEKGGEITIGEPPKAKPVKELTSEDVVGSYEARGGGDSYKQVFLDNGVYEWHVIGKKEWGAKWKIVNRELHIDIGDGYISVWKINEDNSITKIAYIEDGKRTGLPKEPPLTYIKIK